MQVVIGRRVHGVAAGGTLLVIPALVAAVVTIRFPIVGLWDALSEGVFCGVGLLFSAHRIYADPRDALLTIAGAGLALFVLEFGVRLFLPPPPAYPIGDGPHLLLSTFLRTTGPDSSLFRAGAMPRFLEREAMQADLAGPTLADRPPSAMLTKEIVCSILYGSTYSGVIDVDRERSAVFPDEIQEHPGKTRRVLHLGDSMVYGAGVARSQTFVAHLGELEPEIEHVNGGISGTAPDDYLALMHRWLPRLSFDLVVMYLFEGNDLEGLDAPHPCSNWESILSYDGGRAELRFPAGPKSESR
ncbi:MAG TPA: hypothetical protein VMT89_01995, partial [Candidatus Acidoferrales bacterium]|nr:hypothetical protein [Candidatus Acidoferrales bacterium]